MLTLVRLEADAKTLTDLIKDLDKAEKGLSLPGDYHVHDEHYERVHDTCFKGRRVFKPGAKSEAVTKPNPWPYIGGGSTAIPHGGGYTIINTAGKQTTP